MKSVYETSNSLEAHMILNLLSQEGIVGRIDGEYLLGGMGELQAMGFIRVLVPDNFYDEALKIIAQWESTQPPVTEEETTRQSSSPFKFIIGIIFGIVGMYIYYSTPITTAGIDHNADGILDEKWFYKNNRITKTESDRNFNGKVDLVHFYDRRGIISKTESDDNFDGIFETTYKYENGHVVLQESDLNNDGKIDYISTFEYGILKESIIFGKNINSPQKHQIFELHKLISAEFDADGDGIFEKSYEYDYFEEQSNLLK